ncbi:hypothetical protein BH10BDE1_BH10BDE1_26650 [soil metagenome]
MQSDGRDGTAASRACWTSVSFATALSVCYHFNMILLPLLFISSQSALASGLDVQLKDLRGSYFYVMGEAGPAAKECTKLVMADTKKYGRLTHCDPEQDHVMCKPTDGSAKLFLFEAKEACETSLKKGVEPAIDED